jgi:hypothetical protein
MDDNGGGGDGWISGSGGVMVVTEWKSKIISSTSKSAANLGIADAIPSIPQT